MNHCKQAREGGYTWSKEYMEECRLAFIEGYAKDIMCLSSLEARRRALSNLPNKFRADVEKMITEKWVSREK